MENEMTQMFKALFGDLDDTAETMGNSEKEKLQLKVSKAMGLRNFAEAMCQPSFYVLDAAFNSGSKEKAINLLKGEVARLNLAIKTLEETDSEFSGAINEI